MADSSGPFDVVIIGAGIAGLAAAMTLRQARVRCIILEAMSRVGGRALTDNHTFGVPWDRGCHWFHSGSRNPFVPIAERLGVRFRRESVPWRLHGEDTELLSRRSHEFAQRGLEQVIAAGGAGIDTTFAACLEMENECAPFFDAIIVEEFGVHLEEASTLDRFRYADTAEDWAVIDGFGTLVQRFAEGAPVKCESPVQSICTSPHDVQIVSTSGRVRAQCAILTVSVGVLREERISFSPRLPDWKLRAIEGLMMGRANKIAFELPDRDDLPDDSQLILLLDDGQYALVQIRPFSRPLALVYAAGRRSDALELLGPLAMEEFGKEVLRKVYGRVPSLGRFACTLWGATPWTLGAYSAARPGCARMREEFAAPVHERLLFAGEATSIPDFSTAQGAYESGVRAAREALQILGGQRSSELQRNG